MVFWRCEKGPLTGAVQNENQLQELGHEQVGSSRSVLHCHGVLALQDRPCTGAVQDERQLQENTSKLAVGSAEEQAKSRFGASF